MHSSQVTTVDRAAEERQAGAEKRASSMPDAGVTTRIAATSKELGGNRTLLFLAYPSLLIVLAIVLTVLRLSGTSVGMYMSVGAYVPLSQNDPALVAGTPRMLRWDEWVVDTPYIVSQSKLGYPRYSPSGVGGQDLAVIGAIPSSHWSTVFKPYNWPFFLLDLERAFAARWWLIGLLLLIPSYALFFVLTGRIALAIGFSASLFLSPFFHWWYLPVSLAAPGLAMAALASLIEANRRVGLARGFLLAVSSFSLVSFALVIYPPYQISAAIVIGMLAIGWLAGEVTTSASRAERVRPLLVTGCVGLIAAAILFVYYIDVASTISAIANTSYPGQRRVAAGGGPVFQILGGPFDFWLTRSDSRVNQPEAASFLLTGVFIVPQLVLMARYRSDPKVMRFLWPAMAAMILLLAWALLPLPGLIGRVTLLDRVPTSRVILGIGLASFLVTFLTLAAAPPLKTAGRLLDMSMSALLVLGAGVVAAVGGFALRSAAPSLGLRRFEIAAGCLVFMVLVGLVLMRRSRAAALALILVGAVMSLPVNPLFRGLGPLESSPLLQAVNLEFHASSRNGQGAVLSYLGSVMDPLVVSSGRPVLNAANLYPNAAGWHALDPNGSYSEAWNRYSGTDFVYSPSMPAQIRNTTTDAVVVAVNPCDPGLDRLRVTTVISAAPLTDRCLTEAGRTRISDSVVAFTYERNAQN
jgi:hypothetical protein